MSQSKKDPYEFPSNMTQQLTDKEQLKMNARIEKWRKMLPEIPRLLTKGDSKLKSRLRKGIPSGLRMLVWPLLAEVEQMKVQAKRTYQELIESKEVSSHDSQITLDVMRTFQNNDLFKIESITSQSLYTVLRAISLTFQDMGYCQGLNYLAGSFLLQMNNEMAYWHIYSLLTKYQCLSMYINPTNTLKYFYALDQLIKKFLPEVHHKLAQLKLEISLFAFEWFITLFSSILPMQIFLRIMDVFWFEQNKTIFRASLAILKIRKEEILNAKNEDQLMAVLKDFRFFKSYDPDDFITIAIKGFVFAGAELQAFYTQYEKNGKKK